MVISFFNSLDCYAWKPLILLSACTASETTPPTLQCLTQQMSTWLEDTTVSSPLHQVRVRVWMFFSLSSSSLSSSFLLFLFLFFFFFFYSISTSEVKNYHFNPYLTLMGPQMTLSRWIPYSGVRPEPKNGHSQNPFLSSHFYSISTIIPLLLLFFLRMVL